ncbi:MAG: ABC transporter permease [Atopobiaceae bacterium]|nr:ABC transporter permease [Atopobiaceae bacterium]
MYSKIALGNVKKSLRDFSIYFLTLAVGVALFYAFNSITQQSMVLKLSEDTRKIVELLSRTIFGVSTFLAVILGFLVVYANQFLIRRRKKEFGLYQILGMTKRNVSKIMIIETLSVGCLALVVGLIAGIFVSQFMMFATAHMFNAPIDSFTFVFSLQALLQTIIYFVVIFLVALIFNVSTVSRYKLIDLINADKVSQTVKVRNLIVSVILFIVSIILIACSYMLLRHNGMKTMDAEFLAATALVSVGTALFFFSISGFLLRFLQTRKSFYFKGLHAFILRQFNARVNTAWVSISLVCAMLFIAICGLGTGFSLVDALNTGINKIRIYDMTASIYFSQSADSTSQQTSAGDYISELQKLDPEWNETIKNAFQVDTYYLTDDSAVPSFTYGSIDAVGGKKFADYYVGYSGKDDLSKRNITVMRASQYNKLREASGLEPIDFGTNGYMVWTADNPVTKYWQDSLSQNPDLTIQGTTFHAVGGTIDVDKTQGGLGLQPMIGIVVLADQSFPKNTVLANSFVYGFYKNPGEAGETQFRNQMKQYLGDGTLTNSDTNSNSYALLLTSTSSQSVQAYAGLSAIVTYLALYIGLILFIACATILALQQLSEASDNARAYQVLAELGAEKGLASRALFVQIGVYFLFPLLVASAHAICAMPIMVNVIKSVGSFDVTETIGGVVGVVAALYGGYFLVTFFAARSIIFRDSKRIQ